MKALGYRSEGLLRAYDGAVSVALVVVCQACYGPVVVVEQLELVPEEDMGWHHAIEVCLAPGCDWCRARDVALIGSR